MEKYKKFELIIPETESIKPTPKTGNKFTKSFFSILRVILSVVILSYFLFFFNLPYMFQAPGSAEDTSKFVSVEGAKKFKNYGKFFLTTVIYERSNLLFYIWSKFDSSTEIIPIDKTEEKITDKTRNSYMRTQMDMSKLKSEIAAFRALGYEIPIKRSPVEVMEILPWSKAKSILKINDLILNLDGKKLEREEDLIKTVEKMPPDGKIKITVLRNGKKLNLEVPLTEQKGKAKIGIFIMSNIDDANLPMKVNIDSKNIIGASAGLMFCLEIMRQASGVDLTGGNMVAGTGVIDETGRVYPIEGVRYKIFAAQKQNAKYFLCPKQNFEDAKAAATKIKVYSVENLKDALKILKDINPSATIEGYKPNT